MNGKFKVWDNELKQWYKPIYKDKEVLEEGLLTMAGEFVIRKFNEKGNELSFQGTTKRYEVCFNIGVRDVNKKHLHVNDVVKLKDNSIGFLQYYKGAVWIASGDSKNPHALDQITHKELTESENIGNVLETPDYYKLVIK